MIFKRLPEKAGFNELEIVIKNKSFDHQSEPRNVFVFRSEETDLRILIEMPHFLTVKNVKLMRDFVKEFFEGTSDHPVQSIELTSNVPFGTVTSISLSLPIETEQQNLEIFHCGTTVAINSKFFVDENFWKELLEIATEFEEETENLIFEKEVV